MIGYSIATIEHIEPDLAAQVPSCVEMIAAALYSGFRLLPTPAVNHEDVLTGCARLQQFKDAKAAKLQRIVRFHFIAEERLVFGEKMGIAQFCARWQSDRIFVANLRSLKDHQKWMFGVSAKLAKARRSVVAQEASLGTVRAAYGAIRGNPQTLAAMAQFQENGGI